MTATSIKGTRRPREAIRDRDNRAVRRLFAENILPMCGLGLLKQRITTGN